MPKPIENDSKYIRITVNSVLQRNPVIWNQKIKDMLTFTHIPPPVIAFRGHCCRLQGCLWTKHPWKSSVIRVGGNPCEYFSRKKNFLMAKTTLPALRRDKRWALCAKLPSLYLPPLDLVNKKYLPGNKDWTLWWLLLFIQTSNLIQSPPPSDISANLLGCDWLIMW